MVYYDYHGDPYNFSINNTVANKVKKKKKTVANKKVMGKHPYGTSLETGAGRRGKTQPSLMLKSGADLSKHKVDRKRSAGPNATVGSAIDVTKKHLKSRNTSNNPYGKSRISANVKTSGPRSATSMGGGAGFMASVDKQRLHRNSPYRKK